MTEEDAADVVASYGRAAADAKRLGFDALEVHAAHGYLVDQFFWAETNLRGDRFGGAGLRERAQFGAEIFREMRRAVGEDFVIMMRISQWKTGFYDKKDRKSVGQGKSVSVSVDLCGWRNNKKKQLNKIRS